MVITKTTRKIIIEKIHIGKLEKFKSFEIRIPSNAKKITKVLITASL